MLRSVTAALVPLFLVVGLLVVSPPVDLVDLSCWSAAGSAGILWDLASTLRGRHARIMQGRLSEYCVEIITSVTPTAPACVCAMG